MRSLNLLCALSGALLSYIVTFPLAHAATDNNVTVNVVVDLTEAGKKLVLPTTEKPIYYFALAAGYHERGSIEANQTPPQRQPFLQSLVRALGSQNYKPALDRAHSPTILLVFHWGHVNPDSDIIEDAERIDEYEKNEMRALVAGNRLNAFRFPPEDIDIESAAQQSRYFVMIRAYDFEDAKKHIKTLLWSAKISVPSIGISADEAMLSLVRAGAPYFGKQTPKAQQIVVPVGYVGRIEAGPTVTKELMDETIRPENDQKP